MAGALVLAQAAGNAAGDGDQWTTAAVAFGAALVGGLLGALGSRWATRRDLVERNRHALLMEDMRSYRDAKDRVAVTRGPTFAGPPRIAAQDALVEAVDRIYVRTRILSARERRLGGSVAEVADADAADFEVNDLKDEAAKRTVGWRRRQYDRVATPVYRWRRRRALARS